MCTTLSHSRALPSSHLMGAEPAVRLQRELGVAYLFITHNFGVVECRAHDIAAMKEGRIVEAGPAEQILERPQHLYTQHL